MTIETDINLMEHAGRTWRFVLKNEGGTILPLDNFMIYGAAACPGQAPRAFEVHVDAGVAVARMPGLPLTDYPWTYQLFAQEKSSRVEWLLCHGAVNLHGRVAGGSVVLDPELLEFTGVLDSTTHTTVMVIGESTLSISENVARAIQAAQTAGEKATEAGEHAAAADKAAQTAGEKATAAGEHAAAAGKAAQTAGEKATAAGEHAAAADKAAQTAGEKATAASEHAAAAGKAAQTAGEKATAAGEHATAADKAAQTAGEKATAAGEHAAAAGKAAQTAGEKATEAGEHATAAQLEAAKAKKQRESIEQREAAMLEHLEDGKHHVTAAEHEHLQRLIATFPAVQPDTPGTVEPPQPDEAISHAWVREFFAKNAQPGVAQAPSAVYMSRVPWARWDEASKQWLNNASKVDELVFNAPRKLMDNAGLRHAPSTDTVEGVDDYNGKLWPFFWARGNYVTDEYGVKHLTAVEGQVVDGVSFDPNKPVGVFGPAFHFFCTLNRWKDPETGQYTTADGTAEAEPLFQLWGITARPWEDLDEGRQAELTAHGVRPEDVHRWPEAMQWDAQEGKMVPRPYWIHSAYCGGYELDASGAAQITSKANLPLYNILSHNTLNEKYGYRAGFGGSAAVNGFGMLFDIVKNDTKNSQSIHTGMASNNCGAVKATLSTGVADYVFPIASTAHFRVGCTCWLWQSNSASGTTAKRSMTVQIGRIEAIETRQVVLVDGSTAESLCLVFDPATVEPFLVRTGATNEEAIAATKELTDAGTHACCFATQGMALTGETDRVIGKHDGSRTSNTDSRHPYRVQGTEYMPGIWICAADTVAIKGNGTTAVEIDGEVSIPTASQYIILQAGAGVKRRSSGSLTQYLSSGYTPVGVATGTSGYILNERLSSTGVAYPVAAGGTGSGSGTGHADNYWVGGNPAEFLMGGTLADGALDGSASLYLGYGLSSADRSFGARD